MALSKGFVTTAATTALDGRLLEQALLVKNTNDVPRQGLLYGDINPVKATSAMSVTINDQVVFAVARASGDGVNIITNIGVVTVALSAAPSANSRYDVIYVKHNDTEKGDPNSLPVIDKVTGTAAASPTVPAAPSGALVLATVLIPAGVTATNASGVVITNVVLATALLGSPIRYRTTTEMRSDVANVIDGTQAYVKSGGLYWLRGGVWSRDDAQTFGVLTAGSSIASGTTRTNLGTSATVLTSYASDPSLLAVNGAGFTAVVAGYYDVSGTANWTANATGERYIELTQNAQAFPSVRLSDRRAVTVSSSGDATIGSTVFLNAGDVVNIQGWQNSGATLNYGVRLAVTLKAVA